MSNTSKYKEFHFKELNGTREFRLRGFYVNETDFEVSNFLPNADFTASRVYIGFVKPGLNYAASTFYDWAVANRFKLYENGVDLQGPIVATLGLNSGKTVLTITFSEAINKTGIASVLKAAITIARDGVTFIALDSSDTVGTVDGSGTTVVLTFNTLLSGTTNKIAIAAGALTDALGNLNVAISIGPLDVTAPAITLIPADSATGVKTDSVFQIVFAEKVTMPDGSEILPADLLTMVTLKETDNSGAVVPFTAHMNEAKTEIFITPVSILKNNQVYYLAVPITSVIDSSGNANAATTSTFTTIA